MAKVDLFAFEAFDNASIELTRTLWIADANRGLAFPTEVERLINWADENRVQADGKGVAYGLFEPGKKSPAQGICEVVITRQSVRSKWIKMVRLHLSPAVDDELQQGKPEKAMKVFTSSIMGSIRLQSAHSANTLKVFGRTNEQLTFLRALVTHLQTNLPKSVQNSIKASIEGRFLSIVVKPQQQEVPS